MAVELPTSRPPETPIPTVPKCPSSHPGAQQLALCGLQGSRRKYGEQGSGGRDEPGPPAASEPGQAAAQNEPTAVTPMAPSEATAVTTAPAQNEPTATQVAGGEG